MVPETLPWWEDGERHLATALGRLVDEEFDRPSRLPGWSRRTVLAHVARNADALVNLLTWARTGVETPMYPSQEARDAGIAETARLGSDELRGEVLLATKRLVDAVREMPEEAWTADVRTFQGRTVPAAEVPWMRCREVWVHAVDLDTGVTFADVPEDVQAALVDDVFRMWDRRDTVPDVVVFAGDREWGTGALAVAGSLPAVTAWVTGRSTGDGLTADGPLPALAPWL
ncbi:maleylpyruvate isomerase N-terminal domain-containing protein [Geodermatophilus sp. SYSU D00691]